LRVVAYHDPAAFDYLAEEWSSLLHRSAADSPFLSPAYLHAWWRHLGEGELLLLTARADTALVGVAPLFAVERAGAGSLLRVVGCEEVSDYLDWIAAPGQEEAVLEALLAFLASPMAPPWTTLVLCNVHHDSPTLRLLPAQAAARGWPVATEVQEVCPVVTLPATWEEYLAALDSKDRHELRRKLRRAEAAEGLHWYLVGPEDDLDTAAEDFLTLMARSSPAKAAFLTPPMRAFFHELTRVAAANGWLQLAFLELDGRPLAAYFNFVYNNRVLVYNSGLDWQADPGLGAGIVLTAFLIRHAIEEGRQAYDFLRGREAYKYRFGGQDVPVHRITITAQPGGTHT